MGQVEEAAVAEDKMIKKIMLILLCFNLIFIVGCAEKKVTNTSASSKTDTTNYKEITVIASNWKFTPSTIEIKKGENVKLNVKSTTGTHGISIPDLNIKTGKIAQGEEKTVTFTANKIGTFSFRCNVYCGSGHSTMTGRIIVK